MKLSNALVLSFTFLFSTAFAFAADIAVPRKLIEQHVKKCPDFEKYKLHSEGFILPPNRDHEQKKLFILGCEIFAYNTMERAYIVDQKENSEEVWVPEIDYKGDLSVTSALMGAGFDDLTRALYTFQKGRGIGDCGSSATYYYDHEDEKFILLEARLKMHCDGDTNSDWPVVYKKEH